MNRWKKALFILQIFLFCCPLEGEEPDNWLYKNNEQFLDILMPCKPFGMFDFPNSVRWIVTIRIEDPFNDPLLISLRKYYSGKVEATTIRIMGDSLLNQVRKILSTNSKASIKEVAKNIKLAKKSFDESMCSTLPELSNEFERVSIMAVLPDELVLDSTQYNILIESLHGNRIHMLYNGPGPKSQTQRFPIIDWAERIRKLIDRDCK